MHLQFFTYWTLPDIAGGRRMHALDDAVADKDVAKILFHHHQQRQGRDVPFLSSLQSMLAVAAVVELRDFEPQLQVRHVGDRSEMELLAWLMPQLARSETLCWNEKRDTESYLRMRALIHQEPVGELQLIALDEMLGADTAVVSLEQMALRFALPTASLLGDESSWDLYRAQGMQPLIQHSLTALRALVSLGLRQLMVSQSIDEDAHDELQSACAALPWVS